MAMWKLIYPGVRFSELLIYIWAKGMLFHKKYFLPKVKHTKTPTTVKKPKKNSNAMMPQRLIYAAKDLRNAIAHNDVIFDTCFQQRSFINSVITEASSPS